jgi:hypothetical protein
MFSDLPKLFDRNFAIAYFLPVSLFLIGSTLFISSVSGVFSTVVSNLIEYSLFYVSLGIVIAWIFSIVLLVLNREIYRLLEGYYSLNPLKFFENNARKVYKKKINRIEQLNAEYAKEKKHYPAEKQEERRKLMKEISQTYPDDEGFVLPTKFGNALRSFEIYPRVMYGLEGIDGWARIEAVLPKEYRELIDGSKAIVDWWVNIGVISFIFLLEFWCVFFYKIRPHWYQTVIIIIVSLIIYILIGLLVEWRATSAAIGWGDYVKSAFDLYRFDLLEKLGIDMPTDRKKERLLWESFSRAILFRLPDELPKLSLKPKKPSKPIR